MGKVVSIEVPDWVDEEKVKELVKELIRGIITEEDIKNIELMLKDLPKSSVDEKVVRKLYYEGKVLR